MWRHDERWPLDWMLKSPAAARRPPAIGHWKSSPFTLCTVWLKTTTWKLRPHVHFLSRNLNVLPSRRLQIYSRTLISCAFGCKLLTCTNTTTSCVWRRWRQTQWCHWAGGDMATPLTVHGSRLFLSWWVLFHALRYLCFLFSPCMTVHIFTCLVLFHPDRTLHNLKINRLLLTSLSLFITTTTFIYVYTAYK